MKPPKKSESVSRRLKPARAQSTDLDTLMLEGLSLTGTERVLEVGAGAGRLSALLAARARELYALEIDPTLAEQTASRLRGHRNVHVIPADGSRGWPDAAPYQAIVVGGGLREVPSELIDQLELGGRLVVPLGDAEWQLVERFRKRVDGLDTETLGGCRLEMLSATPRKLSRFPWASGSKTSAPVRSPTEP